MNRSIRFWVLGAVVAAGVSFGVLAAIGSTKSTGTTNNVLSRALDIDQGLVQPEPHQASVSGGVVNAALDFSGALDQRAEQDTGQGKAQGPRRQRDDAGLPQHVR